MFWNTQIFPCCLLPLESTKSVDLAHLAQLCGLAMLFIQHVRDCFSDWIAAPLALLPQPFEIDPGSNQCTQVCALPSKENAPLVRILRLNEFAQPARVLCMDVPRAGIIRPTHVFAVPISLLDLQDVHRVVNICGLDLVVGMNERLQADNFASLFQIQELVFEHLIQFGIEGLVVDEHHVCALEDFVDLIVV
jgi:hypothetical protein